MMSPILFFWIGDPDPDPFRDPDPQFITRSFADHDPDPKFLTGSESGSDRQAMIAILPITVYIYN